MQHKFGHQNIVILAQFLSKVAVFVYYTCFRTKIAILYLLIFYIFVVLLAQFTIVYPLTREICHNTTKRVQWYWTIFVKKDHFSVILSFSNLNWNRISIYIFLSFPSQIYNRITIYFIDFSHMSMRASWFLHCFCQKDHIFWNWIVVPPKLQ